MSAPTTEEARAELGNEYPHIIVNLHATLLDDVVRYAESVLEVKKEIPPTLEFPSALPHSRSAPARTQAPASSLGPPAHGFTHAEGKHDHHPPLLTSGIDWGSFVSENTLVSHELGQQMFTMIILCQIVRSILVAREPSLPAEATSTATLPESYAHLGTTSNAPYFLRPHAADFSSRCFVSSTLPNIFGDFMLWGQWRTADLRSWHKYYPGQAYPTDRKPPSEFSGVPDGMLLDIRYAAFGLSVGEGLFAIEEKLPTVVDLISVEQFHQQLDKDMLGRAYIVLRGRADGGQFRQQFKSDLAPLWTNISLQLYEQLQVHRVRIGVWTNQLVSFIVHLDARGVMSVSRLIYHPRDMTLVQLLLYTTLYAAQLKREDQLAGRDVFAVPTFS